MPGFVSLCNADGVPSVSSAQRGPGSCGGSRHGGGGQGSAGIAGVLGTPEAGIHGSG